MKIALLGDIHGDLTPIQNYKFNKPNELLIQLGDFGFADTYRKAFKRFQSDKLWVVGGNHENQDVISQYPHYLGDYGIIPNTDFKVAWLRGAHSIDKEWRLAQKVKCWWEEEQLTYKQLNDFIAFWQTEKPDVLLSHASSEEGLRQVIDHIHSVSRTEKAISQAFGIHAPKMHFHGHLHVPTNYYVGNTQCRCLGINEILEVNL